MPSVDRSTLESRQTVHQSSKAFPLLNSEQQYNAIAKMKISRIALALTLDSTSLGMAIEKRYNENTLSAGSHCQTSGGSPNTTDCYTAVALLQSTFCYDTNTAGSQCQTLVHSGNCAVVICQRGDNVAFQGSQFIPGANTLLSDCGGGDLIGGKFHMPGTSSNSASYCQIAD